MDNIKQIFTRFYRTAFLVLCGLIAIIYGSFGFIYIQQGAAQSDLEKQITNLEAIVSKPMPKSSELREKYEKITENLTPLTDIEAISKLVDMARNCGIDVEQGSNKFIIPAAKYSQERIGGNTYQIMLFENILVQGEYENVMAFISDLDSGTTMENMVLTGIGATELKTLATGEEASRREEFRNVIGAVQAMMEDNGLSVLNNPIHQSAGIATNFMGDDPSTTDTVEGFPDMTTPPAQKGYTGSDTPRAGYVLYEHDKIPFDNPGSFETVNYIDIPVTTYYYTCESDGEVRQWDGEDVSTAKEYLTREEIILEIRATLNVKIYSKS
jgi:hypothetical protein